MAPTVVAWASQSGAVAMDLDPVLAQRVVDWLAGERERLALMLAAVARECGGNGIWYHNDCRKAADYLLAHGVRLSSPVRGEQEVREATRLLLTALVLRRPWVEIDAIAARFVTVAAVQPPAPEGRTDD